MVFEFLTVFQVFVGGYDSKLLYEWRGDIAGRKGLHASGRPATLSCWPVGPGAVGTHAGVGGDLWVHPQYEK